MAKEKKKLSVKKVDLSDKLKDLKIEEKGTGVTTLLGVEKNSGVITLFSAAEGIDYLSPSAIGVSVQKYSSELDSISRLKTSHGQMLYTIAPGSYATTSITEFGRSLVGCSDPSVARAALELGSLSRLSSVSNQNWSGTSLSVGNGGTGSSTLTGMLKGNGKLPVTPAIAGVDYLHPSSVGKVVMKFDLGLKSISDLETKSDQMIYTTGEDSYATTPVTSFARSLLESNNGVEACRKIGAVSQDGCTFYGGVKSAKSTLKDSNINILLGNYFSKTIESLTTFSVSEVPKDGTVADFILELDGGGNYPIVWWDGIKWESETAPVLSRSGKDILRFFTHDGGSSWVGLVLGKGIKKLGELK